MPCLMGTRRCGGAVATPTARLGGSHCRLERMPRPRRFQGSLITRGVVVVGAALHDLAVGRRPRGRGDRAVPLLGQYEDAQRSPRVHPLEVDHLLVALADFRVGDIDEPLGRAEPELLDGRRVVERQHARTQWRRRFERVGKPLVARDVDGCGEVAELERRGEHEVHEVGLAHGHV